MAKRFIDTEMFNDSWFMNLSAEAKLFYIYLFTNCDHAGIIDLNNRLAEFQTGIKDLANTYQTLIKEFGEKRVIFLFDNYFLLPKFLSFQYGNTLNPNVKAQQSVIKRLSEFNINFKTLSKGLGNTLLSVQEKDIDIDKDKDKDKDIKGGVGEKIDFKNIENTQWFESILRYLQFKIDMVRLMEYWNQYQVAMLADDDLYRDAKDYRAHFRNWVKIQVDKSGSSNGLLKLDKKALAEQL